MWIKFTSDEELEGKGFQAKYSFIPGKDAENSDPGNKRLLPLGSVVQGHVSPAVLVKAKWRCDGHSLSPAHRTSHLAKSTLENCPKGITGL